MRTNTANEWMPGIRAGVWLVSAVGLGMGVMMLIVLGAPLASVGLAMVFSLALSVLLLGLRPRQGFGLANQVTFARALLLCVLAAALADPNLYLTAAWPLLLLALVVLLLDGVDGWAARKLDQCTQFGARFDMEVDAALIMVLCLALWLSGQVAGWVLMIGAMRYAFVAASAIMPWLKRPLPDSFRRKLVCVLQVAALLIALSPVPGSALQATLLAAALLALTWSFAVDVRWLWRRRLPGVSNSHPRTGGQHEPYP